MPNPPPDTALRRDVFEAVNRLIARNSHLRGPRAWRAYHEMKSEIARLCGRHAQAGRRDEQLFDDAVSHYVRGAKL